jgi:hypothetical protein
MTEDAMTKLRAERYMRVARAICAEKCAFKGEMPCWQIGDGLSPNCDEPGCYSLAVAVVSEILDSDDADV